MTMTRHRVMLLVCECADPEHMWMKRARQLDAFGHRLIAGGLLLASTP